MHSQHRQFRDKANRNKTLWNPTLLEVGGYRHFGSILTIDRNLHVCIVERNFKSYLALRKPAHFRHFWMLRGFTTIWMSVVIRISTETTWRSHRMDAASDAKERQTRVSLLRNSSVPEFKWLISERFTWGSKGGSVVFALEFYREEWELSKHKI